MKKLGIILFSILAGNTLFAQQQPVTDLYLFEGLTINPAYAGANVQFSATAIHRDQWVNFPGSPVTDMFSVHSSFMRNRIGVGIMFSNDIIGIHNDLGLYGSFSYKITTPVGVLSMGLQGGFNNIKTDFNKLNLKDLSDNLLTGAVQAWNPNFGTGLYFTNYRTFLGLSVPFLINSSALDVEGVLSEAKRYRYYYLYGGTTFNLNKDIMLKPSALIRFQEGAPLTFDMTMGVVFYETVKFGTTYRLTDNITFLFELELLPQLHVGYAFEYTTSEIAQYSHGTHELMVNFRFRSDRIHGALLCPSYY
ncbi:MAG: PorP/SprF family type IX secretion system membrane protein [Bacteroidota bacterium]